MSDWNRAQREAWQIELQMPTLTWDQRVAVMAQAILRAEARVLRNLAANWSHDVAELDDDGEDVCYDECAMCWAEKRAAELERAAAKEKR